MASGSVEVPFPVGGMNRRLPERRVAPRTSPDLLNVRAVFSVDSRRRGGQRPGLRKFVEATFPPDAGESIDLLAELTVTQSASSYTFADSDDFNRPDEDDLGDGWAVTDNADGSLKILDEHAQQTKKNSLYGNVRSDLAFSGDSPYWLQVQLALKNDAGPQVVHLYARMDQDAPDPETDGITAELILTKDGPYLVPTGSLLVCKDGEEDAEYDFEEAEPIHKSQFPQTYRLSVDGNDITVTLGSQTLLVGQTIVAQSDMAVGMGLKRTGDNVMWLDEWQAQGTRTTSQSMPPRTMLFVGAGGRIFIETETGDFEECTDEAAKLPSGAPLMAAQLDQELVVAVYDDPVVVGSDGVIGGAGHEELTADSVDDWTTLGIDTDIHGVLLRDCEDPGPTSGVYEIASVASDKLTLTSSAGADGDSGFKVVRLPLVYTYPTGFSTLMATAGSVPVDCQIVTRWGGRLVWARNTDDPHDWFMSRQWDARDYDYGQSDDQAACAGNSADAGKVFDAVLAVIPFTDDYLLFGCAGSMWRLSGDPMQGGKIDAISYKTGVIGRHAWCATPDGSVYFVGPDGFGVVAAGWGIPENLSGEVLPRDLANINTDAYQVRLEWDHEQQGVAIFVVSREEATSICWFYDPRAKAFWRDVYPTQHGPVYALLRDQRTGRAGLLILGGRDGVLRRFDPEARDDDGEPIESYVVLGPVSLGPEGCEGILTGLLLDLDSNSDTVDIEVRPGRTAQEAINATPVWSRRIYHGGSGTVLHARVRGAYATVKLSNDRPGETWAMDALLANARAAGRRKA